MQIQQIVTGPVSENCYLLYNEQELLIVDPGSDGEKIIQAIEKTHTTPIAIILTHTHYDHIGAVDELREKYTIPVYVSSEEQSWLGNPKLNLSERHPSYGPNGITAKKAEHEFILNEPLTIGSFTFTVVPTPGHSIGSVSFVFDQFVVCGDALFKGSIGRTDLHTGDLEQLLTSIRTYLFTLPDHFTALPGHGSTTTIGDEKSTNPFFNSF